MSLRECGRGQAVHIAPAERMKFRRRQMAAAARKKESVSLSLFHHDHACSAGGCLVGEMEKAAEGLEEADLLTFRPGDK